jgi:hypothetical protein
MKLNIQLSDEIKQEIDTVSTTLTTEIAQAKTDLKRSMKVNMAFRGVLTVLTLGAAMMIAKNITITTID